MILIVSSFDSRRRASEVLKRPGKTFLAKVIILIGGIALASPAIAQTPTGSGPEVIRFEFAMRAPSLLDGMSWFPDNKTLLIKSDGLRLVDTGTKSVSKPLPITSLPSGARFFLSPNGAYLAVLWSRIRLFSTSDWQPLTDWQGMRPSGAETRESAFSEPGGLRFTPDSQFVWVASEPRPRKGETAIAVKLRVPDLQMVDTIQSKVPEASYVHTVITPNSDDVIERAYFYTDRRDPKQEFRRWHRLIVAATNLNVLAPKDVTPDVGDDFSIRNDAMSADHSIYLLDRREVPPETYYAASDPSVFSYDTRTSQRIAAFGFREERTTGTGRRADLSNLLLLKGTDLAVSALTNPNYDGGFRVWNVKTGQLVQSLPAYGVLYLAVSQDQKRIAVQFRDELRVFSVNTADADKH
jgi:hypothetical protein